MNRFTNKMLWMVFLVAMAMLGSILELETDFMGSNGKCYDVLFLTVLVLGLMAFLLPFWMVWRESRRNKKK